SSYQFLRHHRVLGAVPVAVPFSLPPTSFTPNYHRPFFLQCEKQKEEQKHREPRLGTTTTLLASFTNFPEKVLEEKLFVDDFPYFSIAYVERFSWLLCSYQTHVQMKREYFEEKTERCCNKSHICFFGRSFYEMLVGENISFGHDCDMKPKSGR
ncbi:unnamed protein product, partial [Prunus brigantina]